jgi:hydrogenase maturation protease
VHPLRIIGIGSAYGDDQLGWRVVERLQAALPADIPVDLLLCASPASELFGLMADAHIIILVDAVHSGIMPIGHCDCWQEFTQLPEHGLSSHGVDIATILQLTEILGQLARWKVYGVEIGMEYLTQMNVPLTPPIAAVIPELIEIIQQDVTHYLQTVS